MPGQKCGAGNVPLRFGGCHRAGGGVFWVTPSSGVFVPVPPLPARRLAERGWQSDGDAICSPRRSLCLCFSKKCAAFFRGLSSSFYGGARKERSN